MKKVLILFGKKDWTGPAFADMSSGYTTCYQYLYTLAQQHNIQMYRASYTWYDNQKHFFSHAWTFQNNTWVRVHDIKPDLIYDKTSFKPKTTFFKSSLSTKFNIINDTEFSELIDNKLFISLLFPQYCKKQHKISDFSDLKNIIHIIASDKIVLKPATSSGGKDVHIIDKKDIDKTTIQFPILAQEFIDSSNGIPNITSSIHDLRLMFIESELIHSYIRTPAKGSFLANLAQGGSMSTIKNEKLPDNINILISDVQNALSTFKNKIYTIDIMFDENQKPWIIELNSMPGLFFSETQSSEQKQVYTKLIKLFKKNLSN